MRVYYNEIDDDCCDWLSNLMDAGAITAGVIDNRSIEDIRPSDLEGFDRVHFFAGIGVWEYAFIQSGLSAYSGIWTGSCPCQPFSAAGKGSGFDDERHLWPAFFHLIEERRPSAVLGEQVASKDGLTWLDLVSADLEGTDYAFGAGDICAAGFGAPHIRQRLYWSAFGLEHGELSKASGQRQHRWKSLRQQETARLAGDRVVDGLVLSGDGARLLRESRSRPISDSFDGPEQREEPRAVERFVSQSDGTLSAFSGGTGPTNGFWRASDWLSCRDGKWRPVEPGTFPLAHGASSRVVRLRAYGNAIVAPQAIEFCRAVREFIETVNSDI